jgi:hypothetical protein
MMLIIYITLKHLLERCGRQVVVFFAKCSRNISRNFPSKSTNVTEANSDHMRLAGRLVTPFFNTSHLYSLAYADQPKRPLDQLLNSITIIEVKIIAKYKVNITMGR